MLKNPLADSAARSGQRKEDKMNIDEAFDRIVAKLKAAGDSGIRPSMRDAGTDWVCTLDDEKEKFIVIAKKDGLMLVNMKSKNSEPEVQRIDAPEYDQQKVIKRIRDAVANEYGTLH